MDAGTEPRSVHLIASDPAVRAGLLALLRRCGIELAAGPDTAGTVVVAAAGTIDEAMQVYRAARLGGGPRVLLLADSFSWSGVLRAVRAGIHTMLRSTRPAPAEFTAALRSAYCGELRVPHDALIALLGSGPAGEPVPAPALATACAPAAPSLTTRQTEVLTLIAEGHGNAAIARALSCSEHTIKNVIYDLTARLLVRNRAQAVACALRHGLI